ncbi:hypothetical protein C0995_013078 [Termitomyces sp. Mi166|nr:hypothetical protein C0995_013078 [Termitomyces sp. Mi166\
MSFLYDEPITNFFRRISSREKPKKIRKRKRFQEDTEVNCSLTPSDKKPKAQQKLLFSHDGRTQRSAGHSRQLAKMSSLKRGESSESLDHSSIPVDALSRVSPKETPTTRHNNPLPTPLTPRPSSPHSSAASSHSKQRKTADLPTPVTMPRRATYFRAQKSPQSRVRSLSPSRELSSPEPSRTSSIYHLSSGYEESKAVEEGQRDEYYNRDESPSPPLSQKLVPSSQSQADGCFDSVSIFPEDPEPSTSRRHSPIFLVPRLPDKATAGLSRIVDDEDGAQSRGKQPSSVPCVDTETSLFEIHDGEEYVLSSQSQLVLPFHVSPRKNRRKVSRSSSSSLPEDTSDEIIPSSQSLEKELGVMSKFIDDRPHVLPDNSPLTAESLSQTLLAPELTAPCSTIEGLSTSTQVLAEETPEDSYDLPLQDEEPGSVTEEESGDEDGNMFSLDELNSAPTNPQESAPSLSQESMVYPSSLPDAIKEFREMFEVGDGSYPDDFPMSLRD